MMNLVKVKGHSNLYRDKDTGAIVNNDISAYEQYLNSVSSRMNTKREIEQLKTDVNEIKNLLKELINASK
jgi:hypothetical protein